MSPRDQAAAIFRAIRGDQDAIDEQRAIHLALATSINSPNGGMQITESSVNGQSFTARHASTPSQRLHVLSLLMTMIDNNATGTKTVSGRFR